MKQRYSAFWPQASKPDHSMKRNAMLVPVLAVTSLLFLNFQCEKDIDMRVNHVFRVPVDIETPKKLYQVNDTIWMNVDVSGKSLVDTLSGNLMPVNDGFDLVMTTYKIGDWGADSSIGGLYDVISPAGLNVNRESVNLSTTLRLTKHGCGQNTFAVRVGFVPKHAGFYALYFSNFNNYLQRCQTNGYYAKELVSLQFKPSDLNGDVLQNYLAGNNMANIDRRHWEAELLRKKVFFIRVD